MKKVSESYGGGSKGSDFLNTSDGSEIWQDTINTTEPSNSDGQGDVPKGGLVNHPTLPLGEQGLDESQDQPNKGLPNMKYKGPQGPNNQPSQSNNFVTEPFGEQMIDDNHANNSIMHFLAMKEKLMQKKATPGFFFFTGIRKV